MLAFMEFCFQELVLSIANVQMATRVMYVIIKIIRKVVKMIRLVKSLLQFPSIVLP